MTGDGADGERREIRERPPMRARCVSILLLAREHGGLNAPSRVLSSEGYLVHIAGTAAEALRLVTQHKDVAIAVLEIGGQDSMRGTEVFASLLQGVAAERELLAVFLARSPSVNDVVRALRLGAVDVLRSPIEPAHLLDAVARAEAIVTRNAVLRTGAAALASVVRDLNGRATAFSDAVRVNTPAAAARMAAGVDFAEPLDASAQREDTSSLAFTQRQLRMVRAAIKAQSLRRSMIGTCLGEDPCWDMLLDLHHKALSGQVVSVTSLCRVSVAPATTALRRLDDLVTAGLVLRRRDPDDARRVLVQLTETGMQKLRSYFVAMSSPV
jgi:CheY-like chemotaxis protein